MKERHSEQKARLPTKEDSVKHSPQKHRIARAANRPNAIFKKKAKEYT